MKLKGNNAYRNVETYGGTTVVMTECCAKGVCIGRKITYTHSKGNLELIYSEGLLVDDWGNEVKVGEQAPDHYWLCDGNLFETKVDALFHQSQVKSNPKIVRLKEDKDE